MGSAIDVKDFDSALVALGGHALEKDGDVYSFEAMQNGVGAIAQVFDQEGRKIPLAITHGNGLQVGLLEQLYRGEFDAGSLADKAFLGGYGVMDDADDYIERQETPSYAHLIKVTQDVIGGMAVRALRPWVDRAMYVHNTQVIVDPADPRFKTPVKGVGPWREGSDYFDMLGVSYIENPRRPGFFREVVPSPSPTGVRDIDTIRMLASSANNIVLCGGGGGIVTGVLGSTPRMSSKAELERLQPGLRDNPAALTHAKATTGGSLEARKLDTSSGPFGEVSAKQACLGLSG